LRHTIKVQVMSTHQTALTLLILMLVNIKERQSS